MEIHSVHGEHSIKSDKVEIDFFQHFSAKTSRAKLLDGKYTRTKNDKLENLILVTLPK